MTLNQLFPKWPKKNFTLHEVILGEAAEIFIIFPKKCYISPHEPWYWCYTSIYVQHIQMSIYLVQTDVLSTSFLMLHVTFNGISTTLSIQFWYKGAYTRYMQSNDMFILWNCISPIFYKSRECCLHKLPKQHTFVPEWIHFWHHEH